MTTLYKEMYTPAVKLNMFYSLTLDERLDVIFEDIEMIDLAALQITVKTKNIDFVSVIKNRFNLDTKKKLITVNGYRINDTTFFIPKAPCEEISFLNYDMNETKIITGIEYLYHMYHNLKT
jgi:hypothetical protein